MQSTSPPILSVSELNRQARRVLEGGFPLLWVAGEVSNLTRAASGHVYFSLKDEAAQVRCVMFRPRAQLLPWSLAAGQQVEAQVRVSLYEPRGDFQLGVENLRRAGVGRLYEAFARLQQQLAAEGLFAAERKRPLPRYPHHIAVVTSPQAAALQDVRAALARRAPHVRLQLFPTLVQGEGAAPGIVAALEAAGRSGAEVILLVRGGGSIEDLWAFNEVAVARAIAASPVPVVSGVGHETDTTIADFVADQRAATPTAAAELVSAGWFAARQRLAQLANALQRAMRWRLDTTRQRVDRAALRLEHPRQRIARTRQHLALLGHRLDTCSRIRLQAAQSRLWQLKARLDQRRPDPTRGRELVMRLEQRLAQAGTQLLAQRQHRIDLLAARLATLDPARTVARGYAIVRDAGGHLIVSASQLHTDQALRLQLAQGEAGVRVTDLAAPPKPD